MSTSNHSFSVPSHRTTVFTLVTQGIFMWQYQDGHTLKGQKSAMGRHSGTKVGRHKHEDLTSDPQHPHKSQAQWDITYNSSAEERKGGGIEHLGLAGWLASLAELVRPRFIRHPILKGKAENDWGEYPVPTTRLHMHTSTHTHIHTDMSVQIYICAQKVKNRNVF